jgi:hypothetical protein
MLLSCHETAFSFLKRRFLADLFKVDGYTNWSSNDKKSDWNMELFIRSEIVKQKVI